MERRRRFYLRPPVLFSPGGTLIANYLIAGRYLTELSSYSDQAADLAGQWFFSIIARACENSINDQGERVVINHPALSRYRGATWNQKLSTN